MVDLCVTLAHIMKESEFLTKLFLITLSCQCGYSANIISVPPVDTTSCYGGIAKFYCESDRTDIVNIQWSVNGQPLTNETEALSRGIIIITNITAGTTTLDITGLPVNGGIIICTMAIDVFNIDTHSATFTVTDIPPVDNINIEFNNTVMDITWSPPSCVPVNHLYTITVTNNTNTVNYTTTELYYTIPVLPCSSNYTVTIIVIDVGFTQYQSIPVNEYGEKNQEIPEIDVLESLVFFIGRSAYIRIYFEIPKTVCPSTIVRAIASVQSMFPSGLSIPNTDINNLIEFFDNTLGRGNYTFGPYNTSFIGLLDLTTNITNNSNIEIEISTYNVQNLTVELLQNGTTNVTCYFAHNSSANGCNVKLNLTGSSMPPIEVNITKHLISDNNVSQCITVPIGEYEVLVHDIVDNITDSNPSLNDPRILKVEAENIPLTSNIDSMVTVVSSIASSTTTTTTTTTTSMVTLLSSVVPSENTGQDNIVIMAVACTTGIIVAVCVILVLLVGILCVLRNRQRSKTTELCRIHGEIAETSNPTAEPNTYIKMRKCVKQPQPQTVELHIETTITSVEPLSEPHLIDETIVEPDNGHHTSLLDQDYSANANNATIDDDDEDFQFREAFFQQDDSNNSDHVFSPIITGNESTFSSGVGTMASTTSASYNSSAPLLPPRSSVQSQFVQSIKPTNEETTYEADQIVTFENIKISEPQEIPPLPRNSDGAIVPVGEKLNQSQYAEVVLNPKEKRPLATMNDQPVVYSQVSKKDSTPLPPVLPPKQRSYITEHNVDTDIHVVKSHVVEETSHDKSLMCSGVSGSNQQYGPVVPSGGSEVIDTVSDTEYGYSKSNSQSGQHDDNQHSVTTPQYHMPQPNCVNDNGRGDHHEQPLVSLKNNGLMFFSCNDDTTHNWNETSTECEQVNKQQYWPSIRQQQETIDDSVLVITRTIVPCDVIVPRVHFHQFNEVAVKIENICISLNDKCKNVIQTSESMISSFSNNACTVFVRLLQSVMLNVNHKQDNNGVSTIGCEIRNLIYHSPQLHVFKIWSG